METFPHLIPILTVSFLRARREKAEANSKSHSPTSYSDWVHEQRWVRGRGCGGGEGVEIRAMEQGLCILTGPALTLMLHMPLLHGRRCSWPVKRT